MLEGNFSNVFSSNKVDSSMSSKYVAFADGPKAIVLNLETCSVVRSYTCVDKIDSIQISHDSQKVLCFLKDRNIIQAFSISDKEWACRITEYKPGIVNACWSSDSHSIITEMDFGLQLTVWSLAIQQKYIILSPKSNMWNFTKDIVKPMLRAFNEQEFGGLYAVVHRIEMHDFIAIYSQNYWEEQVKFRCRTNDVAVVQWIPRRNMLITVDSPLTYAVAVYTPAGECLGIHSAYECALGVRNIAMFASHRTQPWMTNGTSARNFGNNQTKANYQYISIGSFDGKIRLVTNYTLQESYTIPLIHPDAMDASLLYTNSNLNDDVENKDPANTKNLQSDNDNPYSNISSDKTGVILIEVFNSSEDLFAQPSLTADADQRTTSGQFSAMPLTSNNKLSFRSVQSTKVGTSRPNFSRSAVRPSAIPKHTVIQSVSNNASASVSTVFVPQSCMLFKTLPSVTIDPRHEKQSQFMGVSSQEWSPDGKFLSGRSDTYPRCLWLFSFKSEVKLYHIVICMEPIICSCWRPVQIKTESEEDAVVLTTEKVDTETTLYDCLAGSTLAFCTGSARVYFWNPYENDSLPYYKEVTVEVTNVASPDSSLSGTSAVVVGDKKFTNMNVHRITWSHDGSYLMCHGRENFTIFTIS